MKFLEVSLVVVGCLVGGLAVSAETGNETKTWDLVCKNKVKSIDSLEDMENVYYSAVGKTIGGRCSKKRDNSENIIKIVSFNDQQLICGRYSTKRMYNLNLGHLPAVVRDFAKRLGRDLSARCKAHILDHIQVLDTAFQGYPASTDVLERLEEVGALVLLDDHFKLDELAQSDIVQVYAQLIRYVNKSDGRDRRRVGKLSENTIEFLGQLQSQCSTNYVRFMEPLFNMPTMMAEINLGSPALKTLNSERLVRKWLSVSLLCRAIDNLQLSKEASEPKEVDRVDRDEEHKYKTVEPLPKNELGTEAGSTAASAEELKEAKEAADRIYTVLVGDKLNILDKIHQSSRKFADGLWRYVDSKFVAVAQ